MTALDERPPAVEESPSNEDDGTGPDSAAVEPDERPPLAELLRPALAAACASAAAGFTTGGIFGSWLARGIGVVIAFVGAFAAVAALRSRRQTAVLVGFPFLLVALGLALLVPASGGPGSAPELVRDAIEAGRLLKPPVPFDAGWRLVLVIVLGLLAFTAAWVATAYGRPRAALAVPLPVIGLTAITQAPEDQFLTGIGSFLLVLGALGVIFSGDARSARELGAAFEVKRAIKAVVVAVPLIALLVVVNQTGFLFPKSVYNPTASPQKPRLVSGSADEVLFEVRTKSTFTGPWRTGVLDVYSDDVWKLPPSDAKLFSPVVSDGLLDANRPTAKTFDVTIRTHDLGNTPVLPGLAGTRKVTLEDDGLLVNDRTQVLRFESGRVPIGFEYTMHVMPYATDAELRKAEPGATPELAPFLEIPEPPPFVQRLLDMAPLEPAHARESFLRNKLIDTVTAAGAGIPTEVPPSKVDDMLNGSKKGTPYEIIAAEAMLARWAGVPARIGFGFDGLNAETTGVISVRPRNASQWLEVNYEGFGWVPIVTTPKKAENNLDNDDARRNASVLPSDNVAVEIYVPYEIVDARQLYEKVREQVLLVAPFVLAAFLAYALWPLQSKARRRIKRRHWAEQLGPPAQVAVEYAEFRDLAYDLNVGDRYASPLEYLGQVTRDAEHAELAWLVSRCVFGDLLEVAGEKEVRRAEELAASMRRRLLLGQPIQSRLLARLSRASLVEPYEEQMPNLRPFRLPRLSLLTRAARGAVVRSARSVSAVRVRIPRRAVP